jgi:hypothetical protein
MAEQRACDAPQRIDLPGVDQRAPGTAAVVMVGVDGLQRGAPAVFHRGLELLQPAPEVAGMGGQGGTVFVAIAQAQRSKLLHQRMQPHACAAAGQQRLVDQRPQHRQRGARHCARRLRAKAALEYRQSRQHLALGRAQSLPRVLEHHLDAGVARRLGGIARPQQLAAAAQLVGNDGAGQHAHPGGGQLQRQRQAFDLAADVDHRAALGCGAEVGRHALRLGHEQAHRVE